MNFDSNLQTTTRRRVNLQEEDKLCEFPKVHLLKRIFSLMDPGENYTIHPEPLNGYVNYANSESVRISCPIFFSFISFPINENSINTNSPSQDDGARCIWRERGTDLAVTLCNSYEAVCHLV